MIDILPPKHPAETYVDGFKEVGQFCIQKLPYGKEIVWKIKVINLGDDKRIMYWGDPVVGDEEL